MNIFVANLSFSATESDLRRAFEQFGKVIAIAVIKDKVTLKPKGFCFVEMPDDSQARKAIEGLNGKEFFGRKLQVNETRPRPEMKDGKPQQGFNAAGAPGGFYKQDNRPGRRPGARGQRRDFRGSRTSAPVRSPGFHKTDEPSSAKYISRGRPSSPNAMDRRKKNVKRARAIPARPKKDMTMPETPKKKPFWAAIAKKSRAKRKSSGRSKRGGS